MSEEKQHYIITTTNEKSTYYTFLPSVYQMWKKFIPNCKFVLGLIADSPEDSAFTQRIKQFCDEFHNFPTIKYVDSGVQAKVTRMWLAAQYESDDIICTIVDIDLYLFNFKWFLDNIQPAFAEDPADAKFVAIGHNGYADTDADGKWPMPYTTASSNIWKRITNRKDIENYQKWFLYYNSVTGPIDGKESVTNDFSAFSDESLLRWMLESHPDQEYVERIFHKVDREGYSKMVAPKRIDRGWWQKSFDLKKLFSGYYIDSFPLRPFNDNFMRIAPLLLYLGLDGSDNKLFL
jgi:hypothetical protein